MFYSRVKEFDGFLHMPTNLLYDKHIPRVAGVILRAWLIGSLVLSIPHVAGVIPRFRYALVSIKPIPRVAGVIPG